MQQNQGEVFWQGALSLADAAAWQRVAVTDALTIALGDEMFAVRVADKTMARQGAAPPRLSVAVVSAAAELAAPWATPVTRSWTAPVWARDAAEEVAGREIDWALVHWLIPGGRLTVAGEPPIAVVQAIAAAAGGVVYCGPDNRLRVSHRFPVAVAQWDSAIPDHRLTDRRDNLACEEQGRHGELVNRVRVMGHPAATGRVLVEVDGRPEGPNGGRKMFRGGDTVHLLTWSDPGVGAVTLDASAGTLFPGPARVVRLTQELRFDGHTPPRLDKPGLALETAVWLGRDLGALTLGEDRRTVTPQSSGVGVARVSYATMARSWSLTTPPLAGGVADYGVTVRATAQAGDASSTTVCQRRGGMLPGADVVSPLLSSVEARQSRGRAELDSGEPLQRIVLTCLHRPGVWPGQLLEIDDARHGAPWRAQVVAVTHETREGGVVTRLTLWRFAP